MSGRAKRGRSNRHQLGQHFLASGALASRLVADARIVPADLVIEVGAGTGTLTAALAQSGAHVLALEIDSALAVELVGRFASVPNVTVFACDATEFPLPATPYRVLANPPFNRTSALLHHLFDHPSGGLHRADVVVQWQVARLRAQAGDQAPLDLVGASWAPWWEFHRGRRLPAALFRPAPAVDAAILTVTRRDPALLPSAVASQYRDFVRRDFAGASQSRTLDAWVGAFTGR